MESNEIKKENKEMPRVTRISKLLHRATLWSERILAISILLAMAVFFYTMVASTGSYDWTKTEALYDIINRILLLVICLELIRTLLTHDLEAVLELLAFVVARKTMVPNLTVIDILLSVIAFVLLILARKYCIPTDSPLRLARK
ncbi:MAG: hypothetical protein ACQETH_08845 [Candidatus Rifleibacteriota bacterium]